MEFLDDWVAAVAEVVADSGPYLLLGFVLAGLLQAWMPQEKVFRWMGGNNLKSVAIASAAGVPMPLCSCSVLPVALSLKKNGASKGATTSFLISTPETGVDSISITWALMDPLMTVARPLAALATALGCGTLVNLLVRHGKDTAPADTEEPDPDVECCDTPRVDAGPRWRQGLRFAFGPLIDDLTPWLLFGFVLAGLLAVVLPADFFQAHLTGGWWTYLAMLGLGLPLYICASASTPVAAALMAKGLDPGAALVLLLAGPATNPATMAVVRRFLGQRVLFLYLGSIAASALAAGWLVDWICVTFDWQVTASLGGGHEGASWLALGGGVVLLVLMGRSLVQRLRVVPGTPGTRA